MARRIMNLAESTLKKNISKSNIAEATLKKTYGSLENWERMREWEAEAKKRREHNEILKKWEIENSRIRKIDEKAKKDLAFWEGVAGMPKSIWEAFKLGGAAFSDVAERIQLDPAVATIKGVGEILKNDDPYIGTYDKFKQGRDKHLGRKTRYEKMLGKEIPVVHGNILEKAKGLAKSKEARGFVGGAAEFPLWFMGIGEIGVKSSAPFINRMLTRTKNVLPEAGVETGIQAFKEGNFEQTPETFISNAVLMSTGANLIGELSLNKVLTKSKRATEDVEKVLDRKLEPFERGDIIEAIENGKKADEIVDNAYKIKKEGIDHFRIEENLKEVGLQGKVKVLDDNGLDARDYVSDRSVKLRDVTNQQRDKQGRFSIGTDELTNPQRDAIKDNVIELTEVLRKSISKEGYDKPYLLDDWNDMRELSEKIEIGKATDKELMVAQNGIDEMAYKIPKIKKLQKMADEIPTFREFRDHPETENMLHPEIVRIWENRKQRKLSENDIVQIEKSVNQAMDSLGKPRFRENFSEKFEGVTKRKLSSKQSDQIKELNRKLFGDDDVRLVGQILANKKALGKYEDGIIEILEGKGDAKDTFLHEAVHKYLDVFSTGDEYAKALIEAKNKWNLKGSWADVEEELAERFINFAKKQEEDLNSGFFKRSITKIRSYLKNKDAVDSLYNDIFEGKAKKKAKSETAKPGEKEGKKSKLAQRINENLPEEYKISEFYDEKTIKKELSRASEDIAKDKDKALREAFDKETEPLQRITKLMEFAQIAKSNKDFNAQNALLSRMRREGTETAQALNMFKAYELLNPETNFMKAVVNARIKKVAVGVSDIKKAREQVAKKITEIAKDVKKKTQKAYKVADAQELFNKLVC